MLFDHFLFVQVADAKKARESNECCTIEIKVTARHNITATEIRVGRKKLLLQFSTKSFTKIMQSVTSVISIIKVYHLQQPVPVAARS